MGRGRQNRGTKRTERTERSEGGKQAEQLAKRESSSEQAVTDAG